MDTLQYLAPQIFVSAITAIIASFFMSRFALRRFYSEKWWEKKAEAYSAILESLHYMKRDFDEEITAAMREHDIPDDRKAELRAKHDEARDEMAKRTDIGEFVLSDEAVAELSDFRKALARAGGATNSWTVYIGDSQEAIRSTLKRMRRIAKVDLKRWQW